LYSSPSIIRMIKSRRMRWAGYVAWLGGSQRERDCSEDQDVGEWIILGWFLQRWDGVKWTRLVWLRIETGGEFLWIRYWISAFHKMLGNYWLVTSICRPRAGKIWPINHENV
jgi:hypothetical protein